jgi:hypothetical protein
MVSFFNSYSFYRVAVQKGDVVTFYTTLQAAVDAAAPGSDVYLPGTGYDVINLSKKLNFYGTGHYPSETDATGVSYITTLSLKSGADSSTFCGLYINGVQCSSNQKNLVFKRCKISSYYGSYTMTNVTLTESYLGSISAHFTDCIVQKCFITGQFNNTTQNCILTNNVFITGYIFSTATNNLIKNSIFTNNLIYPGTGNFYESNLFVPNITDFGNNGIKNNLVNKTLSVVFVNVGSTNTFSYNYDYHLKSDSPGKNYGTDGTDVGIYGTSNPYKENAVPEIPHITKSILSSETINGKLPVEIQVEAQTK